MSTPRREDLEARVRRADGSDEDLAQAVGGAGALRELRDLSREADAARGSGEHVLIVPGVMGSTLGLKGSLWDDVLWLDPVDLMLGRLSRLAVADEPSDVQTLGVVVPAYLRLKLHLRRAGFDAAFHAWDWRGSLGAAVEGLARAVLALPPGPVHLVAHSMGGLVAHMLLATGPVEARARLGRVITLGTPSWGAPAAALILQGTHPTLRRLAALDPSHDPALLARDVFASFISVYLLLPWRARWSGPDLDDPALWSERWPRPRPALLARARLVQDTLANVRPDVAPRVLQVIGVGQSTPVGLVRDDDERLSPVHSRDGDGTVPRALATLEGARALFVEARHGSLPSDRRVIEAVLDLLREGTTSSLPAAWTPPDAPTPDADEPVDATRSRRSWEDLSRLLREWVASSP